MTIIAYSDASFCEKNMVAACGFILLLNGRTIRHHITIVGGINSSFFSETYAVTIAIQNAFLYPGVKKIILYTDVAGLAYKRIKKKKRNTVYMSDLVDTLEIAQEYGVKVILLHVRAHSDNKFNNLVDISSRNQLRKYLNHKQNEKSLTCIGNRNDSVRV